MFNSVTFFYIKIFYIFTEKMKNPNQKTRSFLNRLGVYFTERFPILLYFPFVVILYFCLSFLTQILSKNEPFIDSGSFVGIASIFFMMLLIRTFDDLKDVALDHEIFPNRPVSRGAVLIGDVKFLAIFSFFILVVINVLFAQRTLFIFTIMMVYALLTFKWFFAEKLHIENPKIAMVTHQPLPIVIIFFMIHTALALGVNYDRFTKYHFYVLLLFALPITAWEVSRKIKAKVNENKYETFSKIFGIKIAVCIPIILYTVAGIISMLIANELNFHYLFYITIIGYLLFLNYNFIRFLINPIPKNNNLQKVAMTFTSLLFITTMCFLLLKYSIKIDL